MSSPESRNSRKSRDYSPRERQRDDRGYKREKDYDRDYNKRDSRRNENYQRERSHREENLKEDFPQLYSIHKGKVIRNLRLVNIRLFLFKPMVHSCNWKDTKNKVDNVVTLIIPRPCSYFSSFQTQDLWKGGFREDT